MNAPPVRYTRTSDGVSIAYATAGEGFPLVRAALPGITHVQRDWDMYSDVL
ncbi:MAG: hypothetical protein WD904_07055 [Dehalococcoidia bacterium]